MSLRFGWVALLPALAISQEASTDIDAPRRLEWSGNLDAKYSFFHMSQSSPSYGLQFFNKDVSPYLSQYRLEPYLNAEYRNQDLGFQLRMHATYYSDKESNFDIFEAYGSYSPSINIATQAGKRVYNWGKGYAFNPVGFVNPVKDPENPELAQAGLLSATAEYIKSFSSDDLQSFSALFVVIPQSPSVNNRFSETKHTDVALKLSFLLWDTDIDLMTYQSSLAQKQYGLDLSTNLQENIEVHAELGASRNGLRYVISNGLLQSAQEDIMSYLFGIRYLNEWNTTLTAEYYHNGFGLSREEFHAYRNFLLSGLSNGTPGAIQQTLSTGQTYFKSSALMRDYLYLKISQPEPFEWLYFTPSLFTIYNLNDESFLISASLNYRPATNLELIFWPSILVGGEATEFGSRQVREKVELWMRVFF
ncbi:MAG: hypothetical protein WBD36_12670 [Bacteroidota bacterium]